MSLKHSVLARIGWSFIFIVALSVISTGVVLVTYISSSNDYNAMNISRFLHAQTYRLAYNIVIQSPELPQLLAQYTEAINSPVLTNLNHSFPSNNLEEQYRNLYYQWETLAFDINHGNKVFYLETMPEYVEKIDAFALAVQNFSEKKLWLSLTVSLSVLLISLFVIFLTIKGIRKQIIHPLDLMVEASRSIQEGNFYYSPLATHLPNELGLLSRAFVSMSEELIRLYRSLEEKVAEKTEQLTQANKTLAVLYDCSQILSNVSRLDDGCFKRALDLIRDNENLTALHLEVYDKHEEEYDENSSKEDDKANHWIIISGTANESLPWQNLLLSQSDSEKTIGILKWQSDDNALLHPVLLENVTNLIKRGIYFNHSQKQQVQLLLMKERTTIARELHDSLAQALSFLKIQLTILNKAIPPENTKAKEIMGEFEQTLSSAYSQLRELLTTFRLTIEAADLKEALHQLIQPLQARTEAQIHINCKLPSQALSAQQQVHTLQIVREAVINAIKHANAQNVTIECLYNQDDKGGTNVFTITDDGKGIENLNEPEGHYGLNIMHERAQSLNGLINIDRSPIGGTKVELTFPYLH